MKINCLPRIYVNHHKEIMVKQTYFKKPYTYQMRQSIKLKFFKNNLMNHIVNLNIPFT